MTSKDMFIALAFSKQIIEVERRRDDG